jgi:hypothetical protein
MAGLGVVFLLVALFYHPGVPLLELSTGILEKWETPFRESPRPRTGKDRVFAEHRVIYQGHVFRLSIGIKTVNQLQTAGK